MTPLERLLEQQKTLAKRITDEKANEKKRAREKVIRAAENAGLFDLKMDVLEREFAAIAERNKS